MFRLKNFEMIKIMCKYVTLKYRMVNAIYFITYYTYVILTKTRNLQINLRKLKIHKKNLKNVRNEVHKIKKG